MTNVNATKSIVWMILETDIQARNSDSYLYLKVLEYISTKYGVELTHMTVAQFLSDMDRLGVPPFESVRRARQKIQAAKPYLGACERVKAARNEREKEYRAFSIETGCSHDR